MSLDMIVNLIMFTGDGTRRQFPLSKDHVVIGRTNACDLRIPLSSVSRKHCELVLQNKVVKLRDLGSSNGTYRNGVRVQEVDLDAGDQIGIGPIAFTLEIDGEPSQIKPVRSKIASVSTADRPTRNGEAPSADRTSNPADTPTQFVSQHSEEVSADDDLLDLAIADLEEIGGQDLGNSGPVPNVADQGFPSKNS